MRKVIITAAMLFSIGASAQGILNNGAYIVMTGAAQIYVDGGTAGDYTSQANGRITPSATGIISIEGDWNNNAGNTGFTADAGTVQMVDAAQSINGTSSTTFYNLTLLGTNTKTLNVNTSVGGVTTTTGVLSLGTRPLDLNTRMLTITNPAAGAITNSTGYIISETNAAANSSIVRWVIGTNTGARIIPFGTTTAVQIPLTTNTTAAMGASTDYFQVATRPTAASNNLPWSTSVTHMFDPTLNQDGSDEAVIDRWWDYTYSSASTATITFSYRGLENTMIVPYNTGNVGAQYWSAAWLPNNSNIGSAPAVLAGVGTVTAAGIPFAAATFTPLVLSSLSAPLPIELTDLTAACDKGNALVKWSTATEINNDFFTIERSDDGANFRIVGTVNGSGTSSIPHSYSFNDPEPLTATTYYRLRQTDFNGQSTVTKIVYTEPCGNSTDFIDAFSSNDDVTVVMNISLAGDYVINVTDARGRLLSSEQVTAAAGANRFEMSSKLPATGIYFVTVTGSNEKSFSKRIYFTKD